VQNACTATTGPVRHMCVYICGNVSGWKEIVALKYIGPSRELFAAPLPNGYLPRDARVKSQKRISELNNSSHLPLYEGTSCGNLWQGERITESEHIGKVQVVIFAPISDDHLNGQWLGSKSMREQIGTGRYLQLEYR